MTHKSLPLNPLPEGKLLLLKDGMVAVPCELTDGGYMVVVVKGSNTGNYRSGGSKLYVSHDELEEADELLNHDELNQLVTTVELERISQEDNLP